MKPLCIDLFCGLGGWAEGFLDAGYRIVGFDLEDFGDVYPGEFVRADVTNLDGTRFREARVVVASPPCQRFSTFNYQTRNAEAGMKLVRQAARVIDQSRAPFWALENVRGAVRPISECLGPVRLNAHPYFIWGRFPPFLRATSNHHYKGKLGEPRTIVFKKGPDAGKPKTMRRTVWPGAAAAAKIPYELARGLAEACL